MVGSCPRHTLSDLPLSACQYTEPTPALEWPLLSIPTLSPSPVPAELGSSSRGCKMLYGTFATPAGQCQALRQWWWSATPPVHMSRTQGMHSWLKALMAHCTCPEFRACVVDPGALCSKEEHCFIAHMHRTQSMRTGLKALLATPLWNSAGAMLRQLDLHAKGEGFVCVVAHVP